MTIISSFEPLGSQGELVVYPSSLCPSFVRPPFQRSSFSKIFFSETAWPIKAKFYVEPPWEGGTKDCINGPGHMTKMAAICGKPLKIFFPRIGSPMILKLGMQHRALKLYKVYINGNLGLTMTYFTARSNLVT